MHLLKIHDTSLSEWNFTSIECTWNYFKYTKFLRDAQFSLSVF